MCLDSNYVSHSINSNTYKNPSNGKAAEVKQEKVTNYFSPSNANDDKQANGTTNNTSQINYDLDSNVGYFLHVLSPKTSNQ